MRRSLRGRLRRPLTLIGTLAAVAQGAAPRWRRSRPVLVMAIALAGGLVVHLLALVVVAGRRAREDDRL